MGTGLMLCGHQMYARDLMENITFTTVLIF